MNLQRFKKLILILGDASLIMVAYLVTIYMRYDYTYYTIYSKEFIQNAFIVVAPYIVVFAMFRLYHSLWRYVSLEEIFLILGACIVGGITSKLVTIPTNFHISMSLVIIANILIFLFIATFRISFRVYRRLLIIFDGKIMKNVTKKVMIVGAGTTADLILKDIKANKRYEYNVQAFIDDDLNKVGRRIHGIKVYGTRDKIEQVAIEKGIDLILIAIPNISKKQKSEILEKCKSTKAKVKIIPDIFEVIDGKVPVMKARDINVEDLLGRDEVPLDLSEIGGYIDDKVILVTGGGGSIGSELCRQISRFSPKKLIIVDIYENGAYYIENELTRKHPKLNLEVLIGSIRDKERLQEIFKEHKPQVVFHAAAHKHVPLMEKSPKESIKNNAFGTLNIAETAHEFSVERFILISTDKAVNPTNVYGASKRMCEMIIQAYEKVSNTKFVAVRFGNVLGSDGSVIPLFKKQIEDGGPVLVTSKEITRFYMTIPEASKLVLQAGAYAKGGEIFVLDMGKAVKTYDLAYDLIKLSGLEPYKDVDIKIIGLRPGEKLYEELLMDEEGLRSTEHSKIFVGKPGCFNIVKLKKSFDELDEIMKSDDLEEFINKVEEIVPTYIRESKEVAV